MLEKTTNFMLQIHLVSGIYWPLAEQVVKIHSVHGDMREAILKHERKNERREGGETGERERERERERETGERERGREI